MKVVFPCEGSLILLKKDLSVLKDFYYSSIENNSQLFSYYSSTGSPVQIGALNYLPIKSNLVLYKPELLTISKMRKILNEFEEEQNPTQESTPSSEHDKEDIENNSQISDEDILSNPFFQTLKPIN